MKVNTKYLHCPYTLNTNQTKRSSPIWRLVCTDVNTYSVCICLLSYD